ASSRAAASLAYLGPGRSRQPAKTTSAHQLRSWSISSYWHCRPCGALGQGGGAVHPPPPGPPRFWGAIEPIHAVVYFAPEPLEAARKTGLRGFWMSYFASRGAPLGARPAPAVEAMTYGFARAMVARGI